MLVNIETLGNHIDAVWRLGCATAIGHRKGTSDAPSNTSPPETTAAAFDQKMWDSFVLKLSKTCE